MPSLLSYAQLLTLVQLHDFHQNLSHNKKIQQKYHVLSIANAKNYKRENGMIDMSQNTQELPNCFMRGNQFGSSKISAETIT